MDKLKTLNLTLKKKWFDMILSGRKKEEYREVKKYWTKRLCGSYEYVGINNGLLPNEKFSMLNSFYPVSFIKFDQIIFKNGYSKNAPTIEIECKGVTVDQGKKVWGAPNYRVFVLKLGKIISTRNIE